MNPQQALNDYTQTTDGLLSYIAKQLSGFGLWQNVNGTLVKISSSGGYAWGVNANGDVYVCKEPCTGLWKMIDKKELSATSVLDLSADDTFVYILYDTPDGNRVASKSIDSSGSWTSRQIPFKADSFVTTNGFLWISGSGKTAFCGKPCTTGNWITHDDPHTLLSGGSQRVFAKTPGELGIVSTDETAQTGWKPVGGFEGIGASSFAAEADNSVLYGSDTTKLYKCEGTCDTKDQLSVVPTQGYIPIPSKGSLSVNPESRTMWMASTANAAGGNLFSRLDTPNETVLQYVDQVEQQRDRDFNSLGGEYQIQTARVASKLAQDEAAEAIKQSLDLTGRKDSANKEIEILKRKIQNAQASAGGYNEKMIPLHILLSMLAIVVLVSIVGVWVLPHTVLMGICLVLLSVGFGLAIYFSVSR